MPYPDKPRSSAALPDELPRLLAARSLSVNRLAALAGVSQPFLSKALTRDKPTSPQLAIKVARALGLPDDYFPEVRERAAIEALKANPELRERIYAEVAKAAAPSTPSATSSPRRRPMSRRRGAPEDRSSESSRTSDR